MILIMTTALGDHGTFWNTMVIVMLLNKVLQKCLVLGTVGGASHAMLGKAMMQLSVVARGHMRFLLMKPQTGYGPMDTWVSSNLLNSRY